jgi:hypothetical protein
MKETYLKEVQERRTRDLASLQDLNSKIEELQAEAELIQQAVQAYDSILGSAPATRGRRGPAKGAKRGRPRGSRGGSKTGAVVEIIAGKGNKGASPGEIFESVQDRGIKDFSKNYVYTVLHKLKGRNKLREKGGRYFLPRAAATK